MNKPGRKRDAVVELPEDILIDILLRLSVKSLSKTEASLQIVVLHYKEQRIREQAFESVSFYPLQSAQGCTRSSYSFLEGFKALCSLQY
ncbi:hypothetical protein M5689_000304 [Euphorbia peplus]|nr:hypothetical protein M5689_000304 [Euphorbia peplus]